MGEAAFSVAVGYHIVGDMLGGLIGLLELRLARCCEYVGIVCAVGKMIVYVVHYHGGFLFAYCLDDFADELLRIVSEQGQLPRTQSLENSCGGAPGEVGSLGDLSHEVVFY